jgi:hypothetical protein
MISFAACRRNPHFAPLFAHVHVMFWPVLWLSINWTARALREGGYENILFACDQFGFMKIAYYGEKKVEPGTYQPLAPTLAHWSDDSWATNVPTIARLTDEVLLTFRLDASSFLHHERGGGVSGLCPLTEGAPSFLNYDTS